MRDTVNEQAMYPMLRNRIFRLLTAFALFTALSFPQTIPEQDETPIKVNTVLLNVPVMVSDRGNRNLSGLQKTDFQILIDGQEQKISYFSDADGPMTVAILIDTSGSVTQQHAAIVRDAKAFVNQLTPLDEGMVLTFGDEIKVLQGFTNDRDRILRGIAAAKGVPGGEALMNEALIRVVDQEFAGKKGRKAVIVLTDGGEIDPKSFERLRETLIVSDTVVYPIVYLSVPSGLPMKHRRAIDNALAGKKTITMNELLKIPPISDLHALAVATGGRVYAAEASNFANAFQQISDELRKQYVVGFYPDVNSGGRPNTVKINVKRDGAIVRTKSTIRLRPSTPDLKKQ